MDEKVSKLTRNDLRARVYKDSANYSYRLDKNNVDIDTEGVKLAENQLWYQGLTTSIDSEFKNLKIAIGT